MKLEFRNCKIYKWVYWNILQISHIKLLDDNWKYLKFLQIDYDLIKLLENQTIELNPFDVAIYLQTHPDFKSVWKNPE